MHKQFSRYLFILVSASLIILAGCVKERFATEGSVRLAFSQDTLRFDTVFTEIGSATRSFKVYNSNDLPIRISNVALKEGSGSKFRFNIDGLKGPVAEDIEIGADDSIYVFVEVTVDPDDPLSESPFVISEELIFRINGNTQNVILEAWGQNANYIPNRYGKNGVALISCDFNTIEWNDPKPYVIYGILVIDECTLVWPAGARIYIHGGIARTTDVAGNRIFYNDGLVFVGPSGKLNSLGNVNDPVIVEGDRLEEFFGDIPGQWQGIRLDKNSKGNVFNHTTVKNSLYGIFADSASSVALDGCQIYNTSTDGILAFNATVRADNCLIYNNGRNSFSAILGGQYEFNYCTLANYGNDQPAVGIAGGYCYDFPECDIFKELPTQARFNNCVITGSNRDELWWIPSENSVNDLFLEHSLIRIDELMDEGNFPEFMETYTNESINRQRNDSLFADLGEFDFRPDTLSVLENKALPLPGIVTDLEGNDRDVATPDIGCYEYQY